MPLPDQPAQIQLETSNYIVRTLSAEDASDSWLAWLRDPEVVGPINSPPIELTREELQEFIQDFDNRSLWLFGVFDKTTGKHVGVYEIKINELHRRATFNVFIGDKTHWGRNAVIETRASLLDYFFEQCGIEKAIGKPLARNFPMLYNYKAQGWRLEGILWGQCRSALGGRRLHQYQFGLLRSEWRKKAVKGVTDAK